MTHTYRTVEQIAAQMQGLADRFPRLCTLVTFAPASGRAQTWENRPLQSLRIRSTTADRKAVVVVAGQHGYETPGPEALLDFVTKLLEAYDAHTDLTYPGFTATNAEWNNLSVAFGDYVIPASDVRSYIDDVHTYVVPLANPDGRAAVLAGATEWRKNRRPRPDGLSCPPHTLQPGQSAEVYGEIGAGVDLNRNYDIGWGPLFYAQAWAADRSAVSGDPCDDLYRGPSAASEPETQHIQGLLDQVKPRYVLDIHTGGGGTSVTYPWGLAASQPDNDSSSFRNRELDRASAGDTSGGRPLTYREWLPDDEYNQLAGIAVALHDEIVSATNHDQARAFFNGADGGSPTVDVQQMTFARGGRAQANPGTLQDYAYSRHFFHFVTEWPAHAFTLECGFTELGGKAPTDDNHYKVLERVIAATVRGVVAKGAQKCVVATAAYGGDHADIERVRTLRDRELRGTVSGRRFLRVIEPVYYRVGTPVARWLERRRWARGLVRRGAVVPLLQLARGLWAVTQRSSTRELRVRRFLCLLGVTAALATLAAAAGVVALAHLLAG
jgi:murein tripeptide amidase MpaA